MKLLTPMVRLVPPVSGRRERCSCPENPSSALARERLFAMVDILESL
jgi:hypothetical protein